MKRVVVILLAGAVLTHGLSAVAGVYYEATSETDHAPDAGAGRVLTEIRGWVQDRNAKLSLSDERGRRWFLTRDGGSTMHVVRPSEQTYTTVNPDGLTDRLGDMLEELGGGARVSFEPPEHKKVSQGPGPEILGYNTTHTVYDSSYKITIDVAGATQEIVIRTRREYWTTDAVDASLDNAWAGAGAAGVGVPGLDRILAEEQGLTPSGFPLKSVVESTTSVQGHASTIRSTTSITRLDERQIDEDVFEIPSGYERQAMPDLGSNKSSKN